VQCSYAGANADVIENQITEPLEQNINGIPGIRSLTSVSQQGSSRITVEFDLSVDLETAANYIYLASQKKHQIFLSGMGASTVLIKEFQIKMMRLNIQTVFYEDIHLRLEACTNLKKDDLFICFTTLGSSKENYELIDIAHSRNAKIIIITQYGNSKTSEKADITLYTSVIENNLRLASQTSIVLQSMIIDTIFLIIALKDYETISKDVQETKELFHRLGHTVI